MASVEWRANIYTIAIPKRVLMCRRAEGQKGRRAEGEGGGQAADGETDWMLDARNASSKTDAVAAAGSPLAFWASRVVMQGRPHRGCSVWASERGGRDGDAAAAAAAAIIDSSAATTMMVMNVEDARRFRNMVVRAALGVSVGDHSMTRGDYATRLMHSLERGDAAMRRCGSRRGQKEHKEQREHKERKRLVGHADDRQARRPWRRSVGEQLKGRECSMTEGRGEMGCPWEVDTLDEVMGPGVYFQGAGSLKIGDDEL
ncbi:hypothetical protein K490DRAFT_56448 [Saccharata proteae CBS 121410]|uniref:Uncharacterized protein n=1 Tax=Saccharata proteae CBS 121410 TaxID=1314787 RepID=A0A9P4M0F6_9PEZI|nr:hypothetical protein K490DRAFT_56448 [Saccharata proteae CBS 121410]